MPFVKGQIGNPKGHTDKPFVAALKRVLAQGDGDQLREIAERLVSEAQSGESWAVQMLADRLDGKPRQQVEVDGGENPILTKAIVELIHASGSDTKTSTS